MALRTIGINPGPHPLLNGDAGITDRHRFKGIRNVRLVRGWVEQTDMGKGPQLVVSPPCGWISEISIDLMGLYPEDIVCKGIVARGDIGHGWGNSMFWIQCHPGTGSDRDIFVQLTGQKSASVLSARHL